MYMHVTNSYLTVTYVEYTLTFVIVTDLFIVICPELRDHDSKQFRFREDHIPLTTIEHGI